MIDLKQKAFDCKTFPKYLGTTPNDWYVVGEELRYDCLSSDGKEMYYYIYFDAADNLILGGRIK